jgi:hypothetical protein
VDLRAALSSFMEATIDRNLTQTSLLRSSFYTMDVKAGPSHAVGQHSSAAGQRAVAKALVDGLATAIGGDVYSYQQSRDDQNSLIRPRGHRSWFWAADFDKEQRDDSYGSKDIVSLVDVSYYVDLPELLGSTSGLPMVTYDFKPTKAADTNPAYRYRWTSAVDLEVVYTDGDKFNHKLWTNTASTITVPDRGGWMRSVLGWMGLETGVTFYNVQRRQLEADHALTLYTPIARCSGVWSSFLLRWSYPDLKTGKLKRQRVEFGEHGIRSMHVDAKGLYHSVALTGSFSSIQFTDSIAARLTTISESSALAMATIEAILSHDERARPDAYTGAGILKKMLKRKLTPLPAEPCASLTRTDCRSRVDPAAKPALSPFMAPFLGNAFAPDVTSTNEVGAIRSRVTDLQAECDPVPTAKELTHMCEYVRLVVGDSAGTLVPCDDDEVWEKQSRPTQRANLLEGAARGPPTRDPKTKTFMKREAYNSGFENGEEPVAGKDPRNISTIDSNLKLNYSKYQYAVAELLKNHQWYAFGRKPRHIAERVSQILQQARFRGHSAYETDYSRYDGRVRSLFRKLEQFFLSRAFAPEHVKEALELHRQGVNIEGIGRFGTWFPTGYSRLSGSPETSNFNTLCAPFPVFLAARLCGYPVEEAWNFVAEAFFGGDDGLIHLPRQLAVQVERKAKDLGLKLVMSERNVGDVVSFLARDYGPDAWFGDCNSMCSWVRQVCKFHLTVNLPSNVTPTDKLLEKCRSFYLTDRHTPILGQFVSIVLYGSMAGLKDDELDFDPTEDPLRVRSYASLCPLADQYPNEYEDWMIRHIDDQCPVDWDLATEYLLALQKKKADPLNPPLLVLPRALKPGKFALLRGDEATEGEDTPKPPERRPKDVKAKPDQRVRDYDRAVAQSAPDAPLPTRPLARGWVKNENQLRSQTSKKQSPADFAWKQHLANQNPKRKNAARRTAARQNK